MKRISTIICAAALLLAGANLNAKDYYASAFGIKSNGTTLNTTSIQKAIDFISEEGGGKLIFKVGRYVTGTVVLKDNVTIELGEGAILVGSTNPYDYIWVNNNSWSGVVVSNGAKNIGIVGLGVIDGQGTDVAMNFTQQITHGFLKDRLGNGRPDKRPHALYLFNSTNVLLKGINVNNSAEWTVVCDQCDGLNIDGISVNSRAFWNNDGIDIVDCVNTVVQNCFVDSTDDGICLKSHTRLKKLDNILIRNNTIRSSASAIKFGTLTCGNFTNIRIINNTVYDTFRSAIAIEAVDGGTVEDVVVDTLKSLNTINPIYIGVGNRRGLSHLRNIRISNVYAEVPAAKPDYLMAYEGPTLEDEPRNASPCVIVGIPESKAENIVLENIVIKMPGGGNAEYANVSVDDVPELPGSYPEFSVYKELPAWGFWCRHVEGLTFNNVTITADKSDFRPAVVLDDVANYKFTKFKASAPKMKTKIQKVRTK